MNHHPLSELNSIPALSLDEVFSIPQIWREGQSFSMSARRRQSALLWFCGGSGRFVEENGRATEAPLGALVYIPEGAVYRVTFQNTSNAATTILIEFCLRAPEPFALSHGIELLHPHLDDGESIALIRKLAAEYAMPERPYLKLRRDLYALLSRLASLAERKKIGHRGFGRIENSIRYLEHDEKQALSLDEVAALSFVTPAYFRRLFRDYAGVSPAVYRTRRRIERAKDLIRHSEISVAELSELLGYTDPSYFCRVFKRETGISPSAYRQSNVDDDQEKGAIDT